MQIKEIDAVELQSRLAKGEDIMLLDIRSEVEANEGILPNAKYLGIDMIPLHINDLPKGKDIVLYCHSGIRSYHACDYLMQQGIDNVISLSGGITSWTHQGYEVAPYDKLKTIT